MPSFYGACDLVIGRAGFSTLAETLATATPTVLVPGDFAEGHQAANARVAVAAGAALSLTNSEADGPGLKAVVEPLLADSARRATMAEAAAVLAGDPAAGPPRLAGLVMGQAQ
jgi:UDP-N-acetylglucosamine--N-acetylmuramyl-(pentapeptide) pyrophosphoryl-undecaprenol N-acetylglucosamine transferase